jgi:UDP-N-acetylglucosamine--N-acetylmuramyl-(pentapeptide) pyrophosphoryl-undecaprenol N-acetylglucosamine transferase
VKLTIVLTGAGSGGHITPLLAIAAELKRRQPDIKLIYIGQRGDRFGENIAQDQHIDKVYTIRAGKFRRYHGEGWRQSLDVLTLLKNLRDAIYVIVGIYQSWRLLGRLRPDLIFIKGGFVGVPVGLAAAARHQPYITHDSDAIPGLANHIIARWAVLHAVALPKEIYKYPPAKTVTTGVPLRADFVPVTTARYKSYRDKLHIPANASLLFVIGGGLGSQNINRAVAEAVPHLLREFPELQVIHIVGSNNLETVQADYATKLSAAEQGRVIINGYTRDVYLYSGAADVIVTRAGATNLAEFAVQGKACVVVPSAFLAGGHQLKNARYLADQGAAVVLREADLIADANRLARHISDLLQRPGKREELGRHLATFAKPDATRVLAALILEQATLNRSS